MTSRRVSDPQRVTGASRGSNGATESPIPWWKRGWWVLLVVPAFVSVVVVYSMGWMNHRTSIGPDSVYTARAVDQAPQLSPPDSTGYSGGWGPARETYTMKHPATYAVLNSITDNPKHGDERNFVQVRSLMSDGVLFGERAVACPGDLVEVYFLVSNDASDDLAGPAATVHGLNAQLVTGYGNGNTASVGVVLSAKNATSVWDGADVGCSNVPIQLTYVPGSARLVSNFTPADGALLSDADFIGRGLQPVGTKGATGELPVGYESGRYLGQAYILFQMLVTAAK